MLCHLQTPTHGLKTVLVLVSAFRQLRLKSVPSLCVHKAVFSSEGKEQ